MCRLLYRDWGHSPSTVVMETDLPQHPPPPPHGLWGSAQLLGSPWKGAGLNCWPGLEVRGQHPWQGWGPEREEAPQEPLLDARPCARCAHLCDPRHQRHSPADGELVWHTQATCHRGRKEAGRIKECQRRCEVAESHILKGLRRPSAEQCDLHC